MRDVSERVDKDMYEAEREKHEERGSQEDVDETEEGNEPMN